MNERPQNERLLSDILAEETPENVREALLNQTLRLARRRRYIRRARLALAPVVLVAGVICFVWRPLIPSRPLLERVKTNMVAGAVSVSHEFLLETQPLSPVKLVTSVRSTKTVTTGLGYRAREIDDEDLLELASPNPVVLIRQGPHQVELVFANPQPN